MPDLQKIFEEISAEDTNFKPDKWQQQVLDHKGNITIRAGRQSGKSEVISRKAIKFACEYSNTTILILAASQRQSSMIFTKALLLLHRINNKHLDQIGPPPHNPEASELSNQKLRRRWEFENGIFKTPPTKTEANLKIQNVRILCLPAGKTGVYIRGLTIDLLIIDEAAYVSDVVWLATKPMVLISRNQKGLGWIFLLSTPFGKGGFFYDSFSDPEFLQIHVNSENCPRISRDDLRKEKARMTSQEYAQEYLAEFVDEMLQLFPTAVIKQCMNFTFWNFHKDYNPQKKYFLGSDIARFGGDENAFVVAEMQEGNHMKIVFCETTERRSLVDTAKRHEFLDSKFHFHNIYIDDGGVGGGVVDMLHEWIKPKSKVIGLNNLSKVRGEHGKRIILKEEMYVNALRMMEQHQVEIIDDQHILNSLKSVRFEYTKDRNLRIYGSKTHIAEALVRALWAVKARSLKLFIL